MYKEFKYLYQALQQNNIIPIAAGCYFNNEFKIEFNQDRKHAEEILLEKYSPKIIYITMEPCPSCYFKFIQYHVKKIYFGAYNHEYGACGGKFFLKQYINQNIEFFGGFYEEIFSKKLKEYFQNKRK